MPMRIAALSSTKKAMLWTSIFGEPLEVLYGFTAFILYKDLGANAWHLAIFVMIRPIFASLSVYWNRVLETKGLLRNVLWGECLARLPFFFFPWIHDPALFLLLAALFRFFKRGALPSWMEILKRNLPSPERENFFSYMHAFAFTIGLFLSLGFGWFFDASQQAWRWAFPLAALLSLIGTYAQSQIVIMDAKEEEKSSDPWSLLGPWREIGGVMKNQPSFFRLQMGLFISGMGLLFGKAIFPRFFVDVLDLRYAEFAMAIGVCKAIGVALSAPLWAKYFQRRYIFAFAAFACLGFAFFTLALFYSSSFSFLLFVSYLIYGVALSGSHLLWHLSAPLFSEKSSSLSLSRVSLLLLGLRGLAGPLLGRWWGDALGLSSGIIFSSFLIFVGSCQLLSAARKEKGFSLKP